MLTIDEKKIKAISWEGKDVKKIATTDGKVIWQKSSLPDGYKECEYIENPNLGYIDTGIDVKYESNIKQVMVCNFYNSKGWVGSNGYLQQSFASHTISTGIGSISLSDEKTTIICTYKNHTETIFVGSDKSERVWGNLGYETDYYHIYKLGNFNQSPINGIIYSLQLYVSDILVRDFIPVYNTETSEYGLFDKVNKKFYGSSNNNKFTGKIKEQ